MCFSKESNLRVLFVIYVESLSCHGLRILGFSGLGTSCPKTIEGLDRLSLSFSFSIAYERSHSAGFMGSEIPLNDVGCIILFWNADIWL